jgi:multidrug efflux pump subunit AcrA (membrane-fusion protein)
MSFVAVVALAADEIVIERAVLAHIAHADVPASEAGTLDAILVHEGEAVTAGQPVARVDDQQVRLAHRRSELEYEAAKSLADDLTRIDVAKKTAEKQRQMLAELQIDLDVAEKESQNDVPVRASEKAMGVAGNQHQRALRAREKYKDSVSDSEIDGLRLAYERATLDHEQAEFDLAMKREKLAGQQAALITQKIAIAEAELEIRQAEELHDIAVLQAGLKRHDIDAAALAVSRRTVASPIDGVVVELFRQTGEWVEPGEKVLRIIRLNRLRAEGFAPLATAGTSLAGRVAIIEVTTPDEGVVRKEGRISFVSPEADPINQEVRIWAEFDNDEPRLSPGMLATIRIAPASSKPNPAASASVPPRS